MEQPLLAHLVVEGSTLYRLELGSGSGLLRTGDGSWSGCSSRSLSMLPSIGTIFMAHPAVNTTTFLLPAPTWLTIGFTLGVGV